jgi:nucleoside-diphosphate-sugar epimerase
MDLRGRRVLVIGGAGLIGSHVVEELIGEDVAEVVIYDDFTRGTTANLETALRDPRVKIFELGGNILHTDLIAAAMKGIDCVFHLAALWLLHCHDFPRSAFEVNVRGMFNVLEACANGGVHRLILSSSASVYGDAVEEPMTEDHPLNNTNFYGATKVAAEQMCRAFYHRYGLKYVGLRYMNVYGPRQDYRGAYIAVIMKMLDRLDQGLPPVVYGDGSQAYDFVYVGDCARANVCAARADTVDAYYNVGTGVRTTVKELAELVLQLTGSRLTIQYQPGGLTFVKNRVGATEKAKREIDFEAKVGLREGLERLITWRREHKEQVEQSRRAGLLP